jgi:hypothetical protein
LGERPATQFYDLISKAVPPRALDRAVRFLAEGLALDPHVCPRDLLTPARLAQAMRPHGIDGWMPVSASLIHGYVSWLGRWRCGTAGPAALGIAVDARLYREVFTVKAKTAAKRAQSKFLAVSAHELGHVMMKPQGEQWRFIRMGNFAAADWQSPAAEAEAWLFAGILRAFVFADIGADSRPDGTHEYV